MQCDFWLVLWSVWSADDELHILSDLHTEFTDFDLPETDADVVVLAGDVGVGRSGLEWLSKQQLDKPVIRLEGRKFTPADSTGLRESSRRWFRERLAESFVGTTVVVTHHAPSARSVPPRFATDLLTPAFASNLEDLLDGTRVAVWIHGHMHDPAAYAINGSRVICNPRGYPDESASGRIDPAFCVDI